MLEYYKKSFVLCLKSDLWWWEKLSYLDNVQDTNSNKTNVDEMVKAVKESWDISKEAIAKIKIKFEHDKKIIAEDVKIQISNLIKELKPTINRVRSIIPVNKPRENIEKQNKGLSKEVNNFINSSNWALSIDWWAVNYNNNWVINRFIIKENPKMSKFVWTGNEEVLEKPLKAVTLKQWMKSVDAINEWYVNQPVQSTLQPIQPQQLKQELEPEQPNQTQIVEQPLQPEQQYDEKTQDVIDATDEKFIEDIEIELSNTKLTPEKLIGKPYEQWTEQEKKWLQTFSSWEFFQLWENDLANGISFDDVEVDLKNNTIKFSLDDDWITEDFNENITIQMDNMKSWSIFNKVEFLEKLKLKAQEIARNMPNEE